MSTIEEFVFGIVTVALGIVAGLAFYAYLSDKLPGAITQ